MTVTGPGRSKLEQVKNSWLARLFSDLHQALKGEHLAKFWMTHAVMGFHCSTEAVTEEFCQLAASSHTPTISMHISTSTYFFLICFNTGIQKLIWHKAGQTGLTWWAEKTDATNIINTIKWTNSRTEIKGVSFPVHMYVCWSICLLCCFTLQLSSSFVENKSDTKYVFISLPDPAAENWVSWLPSAVQFVSGNDALYAVLISSKVLWMANSLNVCTFLYYGTFSVWCSSPSCFACRLQHHPPYLWISSFVSQIWMHCIQKCLIVPKLC